jgi:PAS domain S-box-containing protein
MMPFLSKRMPAARRKFDPAEELLQLAIEAAPSAMVMVNHEGNIVLLNSQTEKMFGYLRGELLGQPVEMLVPESARETHPGLRREFSTHPQARPMGIGRDLHARRKDGTQFPVEIGLNPVQTANGTWVLSSIVDITFKRQKLESLGVLAGGIAHDFNNLLGSILAETDVALADLAAGSSPAEEIYKIKAVAIRASEIVRQLMIYAGQERAQLEPVDISRLVEEMLELLKISISKHAVLSTDLGKELPAVRGNAPQIRQVIMNVIINASEALGEKDGLIRITTSRVTGGRDLARDMSANLAERDYLKLEVSDTGSGMTKEEKARVFDPFFTTKFAGRGLGLAVVQGIIRAHGGAINIASAPGLGTTFQIFLPSAGRLPEQVHTTQIRPSVEEGTQPVGTVLLVEDEEALRLSVSKMLRKRGFSVIEAGDGCAAVELFRANKDSVDVILLDMTIPGTCSSEVMNEGRRIRPDVKVILTSAYSRDMLPQSLDGQVRGFIRKPFQLSDLVQLLQETLAS